MTPERTDEVYAELGRLVVELDPNPAARGPLYLQDLVSRTRGYLNKVSDYMQEVFRERHGLESRKEGLEAAFQVSSDELLAQDHRVTTLPSIEDRKAMVNLILRDERREIEKLSREIRSLHHVEKVIRYRYKELESTMSAIRTQKSLIDMELRTGSFYGDENDASRGSAWGRAPAQTPSTGEDLDEEALAKMMDEANVAVGKTAEPQPNGLMCSICGEPQVVCPSGAMCPNGHGGVEGVEPEEEEPVAEVPEPAPPAPKAAPVAVAEPVKAPTAMPSSDDDFSDFLLGDELDGKAFAPKSKRIISKAKAPPNPAPQPVAPGPTEDTKAEAEEDPDIKKFLDADEFADLFEGLK
jgi:hypothetical protein